MKIKVNKWDLETEDANGDRVTLSPEEAGVKNGDIFEVDAEELEEAINEVSDRSGWLILEVEVYDD